MIISYRETWGKDHRDEETSSHKDRKLKNKIQHENVKESKNTQKGILCRKKNIRKYIIP